MYFNFWEKKNPLADTRGFFSYESSMVGGILYAAVKPTREDLYILTTLSFARLY